MYSSENLSKGQIIYFFNYKSKAIKEVLSTANEKHFFLQCQLKPFWLLLDTPTYTVKYLFTLYRFPKALSPCLNLPSSLKPTQHSTDSQEEKGSGTTATGFHLSISYSGKKKKESYWYMEQISPWPSLRKECYFCCDCTFTQTGLPLVKLGSPAYEGQCQGSAEPLLSPLWCCSDHLGEELQGVKLHNESVVDTATQPVTAQWSTGHFHIYFFFFFVEPSWNRYPLEDDRKSSTVSYWLEELGSFKAALLSLNLRAGSCPPLKTPLTGNHLLQPGLNSARVRSAEKRWRLGSFHPERREKSFTHSRECTYWF